MTFLIRFSQRPFNATSARSENVSHLILSEPKNPTARWDRDVITERWLIALAAIGLKAQIAVYFNVLIGF